MSSIIKNIKRLFVTNTTSGNSIDVVSNYSSLPSASTVTGKFYWVSSSDGTHLTGLYYSNGTSWEYNTADDIQVVVDYNALPLASTVSGQFYWCSNAVTHTTLFITFTDYPKGLYYSNGVSWEFLDVPIQATQSEVDSGTESGKYVVPLTLANYSKWTTKEDVSNKSSSYTVSSTTTYANTKALVDGLATKQNSLGYTPANAATTLSINGVSQDLSSNRTFSINNAQPLYSGVWLKKMFAGNSTTTMSVFSSQYIYYNSFPINKSITITDIGIYIASYSSSGNIQLAIYDDDGSGGLGSLLSSTPDIPISSTGLKSYTLGSPVTCSGKVVHLAVQASGTTFTFYAGNPIGNVSVTSGIIYTENAKTNNTYGTWPNPGNSNSGLTTLAPIILIKIQ